MTTDLDDYWPPAEAADPVPYLRKCKHPRNMRRPLEDGGMACMACGADIDPDRARRGKTARQRGNAYERSVAARLGVSRVGQYGGKEDVAGDWIAVQVKNGTYYPERIDGWLRSIPERADRLRAVVIGDAPGPGSRRRELIILDLGDFVSWYGHAKEVSR